MIKRFLVIAGLVFPLVGFSACMEGDANAWVINVKTGQKVKTSKRGNYIYCADQGGRSGSYSKGKFSFGYFVCNSDCDTNIQPYVTYLLIGRKRHIGEASEFADNVICLQPNESDKQYCWKPIEEHKPVKIKPKPSEEDPFYKSGPLE